MPAWEITKKDLRLLARDRRALFVLVAFPLVFISILGMSTGRLLGWKAENQKLQLALVDQVDYESAGAEEIYIEDDALKRKNAHRLVDAFKARLRRHTGVVVQHVDDAENAQTMVREAKVNAAVIIGPQFFRRVEQLRVRDVLNTESGRLAEGLESLDIRAEGRSTISSTSSIIRQFVLSDAVRTIAPYVVCKNRLGRMQIRSQCECYESLENDCEPEQVPPEPATPEPADTSRSEIVYQEIVPGYTVMFVFFLVNIMGRSFIQERELGTLRRLRMSPVSPAGLLMGKTLPFYLISLCQTAVLFLAGKVLFGMSWGAQPTALLPVIACTSLAATGLGLLLATLVKTDSQVSAYGNILVISMAGISGCFMPRDWLPELMQQISLATPHAWALTAYHELLSTAQPSLQPVVESCGVLVAFAAAFFVCGCVSFRRAG